jgi:hypothetical protein
MLATNPNICFAGVWARRPEAAAGLAAKHGTTAFDSIDALLDSCDAVAFCVPPDVQSEIAAKAAAAGKHLLLEKPIADRVATAERLVEAINQAGVRSMVLLTWRYAEPVRSFLAEARAQAPFGGRAVFISGGLLGEPFATALVKAPGVGVVVMCGHGVGCSPAPAGSARDIIRRVSWTREAIPSLL